jgi:hypothetical protein
MDEKIKVNFLKPMLVLKIRDAYKAPYHKNKFLIIKKSDCLGLREFKKFMHQFTGNWSSGSYDLQFVIYSGNYIQNTVYSTLIRIDVRDGKVVKLWKNSPYNKKEYLIWEIFRENSEKKKKKLAKLAKKTIVKKKPVKKKIVKKKTIKKKIVKKKK